MLASILLQHHGEFGEKPRTLYSMLANLIDDMEAKMTSIDQLLSDKAMITDDAGTKIKFGDSYYNVLK